MKKNGGGSKRIIMVIVAAIMAAALLCACSEVRFESGKNRDMLVMVNDSACSKKEAVRSVESAPPDSYALSPRREGRSDYFNSTFLPLTM